MRQNWIRGRSWGQKNIKDESLNFLGKQNALKTVRNAARSVFIALQRSEDNFLLCESKAKDNQSGKIERAWTRKYFDSVFFDWRGRSFCWDPCSAFYTNENYKTKTSSTFAFRQRFLNFFGLFLITVSKSEWKRKKWNNSWFCRRSQRFLKSLTPAN